MVLLPTFMTFHPYEWVAAAELWACQLTLDATCTLIWTQCSRQAVSEVANCKHVANQCWVWLCMVTISGHMTSLFKFSSIINNDHLLRLTPPPNTHTLQHQYEQRCSQLVGLALCTMNYTSKFPTFVKLRGTGYAIRALGMRYIMVREWVHYKISKKQNDWIYWGN